MWYLLSNFGERMSKKILIDGTFVHQYRVALVNSQSKIEELEYETESINQIKGNIYLAKIVRIEPALQSAFIDFGGGKNGFLPFSEIHPDYYNIPVSDRKQNHELHNLQAISAPSVNLEDTDESRVTEKELEKDPDIEQIKKFIEEEKEAEATQEVSDEKNDDKIEPLPLYKQYKIQEVIKKGQIILVQAQKEERGNKGASFTSYISLAGKYSVLMPNNPGHHGISRRISNSEERKRLRNIVTKLVSEEDSKFASIIVRTAGIGRSGPDIQRDYVYLVQLWNRIRETTLSSKAPAFIHVEEGIIQKTIRDVYDSSIEQIIVDGKEAYDNAINFIKHLLPNDINKVKLHNNLVPIFPFYGIEEQVASLYQQVVSLPSGGYIVINPTEALTSIDINSGKSTSEKNIEETALKTNVEAAKEIARQFRLRDISGLIVIDFIDMYEAKNRKIVERSIKEYTSRDKAKIQIGSISSFGLLEMSRQRLRPSFLESHTKMCHHCNGKGIVRDEEANSLVILRTIENELHQLTADIANVYAHTNIVLYLLNHKRLEIVNIEEKYGVKLNFLADNNATSDSFSIEKISLPTHETSYSTSTPESGPPKVLAKETYNVEGNKPNQQKPNPNQQKRKKWKDSKNASDDNSAINTENVQVDNVTPEKNEATESEIDAPKKEKQKRRRPKKNIKKPETEAKVTSESDQEA